MYHTSFTKITTFSIFFFHENWGYSRTPRNFKNYKPWSVAVPLPSGLFAQKSAE